MPTLSETLSERKSTHGEFKDNSADSQAIKRVIRNSAGYNELQPYQIEALEMIAQKIGRILNGDPCFKDHWLDIAGYAQLVEDRL